MKLNTIQYIILILLIGSVNLFSSCKDDDGHDAGSPVVVNPVSYTHLTLPTNREV